MVLKKTYPFLLLAIISIASTSCVEEFDFKAEIETFESILVVEATISNVIKKQKIKLSRSFSLDSTMPAPERNAIVKVEDDAQNQYLFNEEEPGMYVSNSEFGALPDRNYKLLITTSDNRVYASKQIQLTQNTKIDALEASASINDNGDEGISISVDTFDPTGNSQFYRYTFEETHKIIASLYVSRDLIVISDIPPFEVQLVNKEEDQRVCYSTVKSNNIIIANTNEFAEDRLDDFSVRFIKKNNIILAHRYSILVTQFVQSREAFTFFEILKELSESGENLFSQMQPGFISGNVFSETNSDENVLGFFEVSSVDSQRIYFNFNDFYPEENPPTLAFCNTFIAPLLVDEGGGSPLIGDLQAGFKFYTENDEGLYGGGPYLLAFPPCGDCTVRGTTVVPDFWIE